MSPEFFQVEGGSHSAHLTEVRKLMWKESMRGKSSNPREALQVKVPPRATDLQKLQPQVAH